MKQQGPGQQRRRQRRTQTFHINTDALRRYGKRTGTYIKNVNLNDRSDGYARWSDYVSESSEDAYIPRQVSSTFSEIQKEAVGEYQSDEHTKLPDVSLQSSAVKPSNPPANNIENRKSEAKLEINEDKHAIQSVQDNAKQIRKSNYTIQTSERRMPFAAPQISNIKERRSGGRDSEKYLLQLLESEKSKRNKQRQEQNRIRQEEQWKRSQQIRIKNDRKVAREHEKMQIQEPYNEDEINRRQNVAPNTRKPSKYIPRQLGTISEKTQEAKTTRSKRVTINDKGKIKLPTDSFSADFQYILPPSLRKGEEGSDNKRSRPEPIKQDQDEAEERPHEPMDIVQQIHPNGTKEQQDLEVDPVPSIKQEKIKRSIRITQNPEKIVTKKGKKAKINPSTGQDNQDHQNQKKKHKKQSKDKPPARSAQTRPQAQNEKKQEEEKGRPEQQAHLDSKIEVIEGQKRKVRKGINQIIVDTYIQQNPSSIAARPQRHRHPPTQYWKGEKPAYNARGSLAIRCDFTAEEFMEMIGFVKPERIQASMVSRQLKEVVARIDLKPRQYLYSGGIAAQKMKGSFNSPQQFDELLITQEKHFRQTQVEIIVDDINKYSLQEEVSVKKGETFQIRNKSNSRNWFLFISLINRSKKK